MFFHVKCSARYELGQDWIPRKVCWSSDHTFSIIKMPTRDLPVTRYEFAYKAVDVMKPHEPSQDPQVSVFADPTVTPRSEKKFEQVAAANLQQLRNFYINRPPPSRWQG